MTRKLFQLLLIIVLSTNAIAQAVTEATITLTFTYSGEGLEAMAGILPQGSEIMLSPKGVYIKNKGGMTSGSDILVNKAGVYKINNMDETYGDIAEMEQAEKSTYTKLDETEMILGYKCQKYKMEDPFGETFVWFTNDIKYPVIDRIPNNNAEGIMLKTISKIDGGVITFLATEISTKPIDPKWFKIPKGFKKAS